MDVSVSSVIWIFVHVAVAGVMAAIGYFDLLLWSQHRTLRMQHITGMLCWSVALTLLLGAVGLALPHAAVFHLVVPIRAVLIGITVALFLRTLGSLVPLRGIRWAVAASVALPIIYGVLGLVSQSVYSFELDSPWPRVQPLGNVLVGLSVLILATFVLRTLALLKGRLRLQLAFAAAAVAAILVLAVASDPGVLVEAMTTSWTLPIAILLATWCSTRMLVTEGSLMAAVSGWREAERTAEHQARHDLVTGLPNRIVATEILQEMLQGCDPDSAIVASTVRLGRLAELRSAEGRPRADAVLRAVAEQLQLHLPVDGTTARIADESFVVMVRGTRSELAGGLGNQASGELIATNIRRVVELPAEIAVSIGISISDRDSSAVQMLERAEMAASAAEQAHRTVQIYRPELHTEIVERTQLARLLKCALERAEFEVHYQPVVETTSLTCVGFEALIRWRRNGKLRPPMDWIPLAEQHGLMPEIGLYVLRTAVRDHAVLRRPIAVNVSPFQFSDPQFVPNVLAALEGLPAGSISLELTESLFTGDLSGVTQTLTILRERGIRVALDDFGTKHSSLSRLVSLPFDVLKIDRSFVANLDLPEGRAIVVAIQAMAKALGKTTVAEGVETASQLATLAEIGCERVQGFHTGKAQSIAEISTQGAQASSRAAIGDSGGVR